MGSCVSSPASSGHLVTTSSARRASHAHDSQNAPNDITLLFRSGVKPPSTTDGSSSLGRLAMDSAGRFHLHTAPTQTSSSGDTTRRHQRPLVGAHFTTIASAANGSLEVHSQTTLRSNQHSKLNLGTAASGPFGLRGTTTAHTFHVPTLMRASISSSASRVAARANAAPLDEEVDASYHASHGDAFDDARDSDNSRDTEETEHQAWNGMVPGDGLWEADGGSPTAAGIVGRASTVSPPSPQRRIRTRDGAPSSSTRSSVRFLDDAECPGSHSCASTRSSASR